MMLGVVSTGCAWYGPDPGQGEKAQALFKKSEPIIISLEKFYAKEGVYPASLDELVPQYLQKSAYSGFIYLRNLGSYELTFSYEAPGVNSCTYTPEHAWNCKGLL